MNQPAHIETVVQACIKKLLISKEEACSRGPGLPVNRLDHYLKIGGQHIEEQCKCKLKLQLHRNNLLYV